MTSQDILNRANDLAGEFGITRGSFARDAEGHALDSALDPRATSFCAVGLISKASLDFGEAPHWSKMFDHAMETFRLAAGIEAWSSITHWNDHVATDGEIREAFRACADSPKLRLEDFTKSGELIAV